VGIADELITRGWTQGEVMAGDGSVCLMGAAACAAGLNVTPYRTTSTVWMELPDRVRNALIAATRNEWVPEFNDDWHRTYDEVLRAAKDADELLGAG
jgi:hypothetical protein